MQTKSNAHVLITLTQDEATALESLARRGYRTKSQEVARLVTEEVQRLRKAANDLPGADAQAVTQ